ncbi:hypothetical protein K439DRAFT_1616765 [Ramaria rubella]|nr:hypothetical protein K439DRAFT_1616765 [Ramaria rubella]
MYIPPCHNTHKKRRSLLSPAGGAGVLKTRSNKARVAGANCWIQGLSAVVSWIASEPESGRNGTGGSQRRSPVGGWANGWRDGIRMFENYIVKSHTIPLNEMTTPSG